MADICPKCGLPTEICACEALVKEEAVRIKVYTTRKRFGKLVTIVEGLSASDLNGAAKELKRKLACGGSAKDDYIVLQGDHKRKVRQILVGMGYNENSIDVR
ncbi:MAG: stress response translation initiation inhibitor YciH [Candidatus ainarchaeum sp.]|nr:stress response translation initiation inhibitor YciH [Candidatus ainarchaeum sp.]